MYGVNTSSVIINSGGRTGEFAEDSADITPKSLGGEVYITAGMTSMLLRLGVLPSCFQRVLI